MFITVGLGLLALVWVVLGTRMILGMRTLPRLDDAQPLADADCPSISILFSARDEEEKLPRGLATFQALDYPRYEIIAVDDRSRDATGRILQDAAERDLRLKTIRVDKLPAGWLGKPHGLQRAYEASTGEWLVFTDADVRFAPDLLRRAAAVIRQQGWDHLTIFGSVDMHGFWEHVMTSHFFFGGGLMLQYWRVSNPRSRAFAGAGMFQMVRRTAYEASGTHRRLAMEILDDVKFGKLIKRAGFRSGVPAMDHRVAVRWHDGVRNTIRGLEKNMFAAAYFKTWLVVGALALFTMTLAPIGLLFVLPIASWAWIFAALAALIPAILQGWTCIPARISPLYGLTYPLGLILFGCAVANSTFKTLRQGGVYWRDTFYPLEDLRRGLV